MDARASIVRLRRLSRNIDWPGKPEKRNVATRPRGGLANPGQRFDWCEVPAGSGRGRRGSRRGPSSEDRVGPAWQFSFQVLRFRYRITPAWRKRAGVGRPAPRKKMSADGFLNRHRDVVTTYRELRRNGHESIPVCLSQYSAGGAS